MISCKFCHFQGKPIVEYRPMEKLISCPKCGHLINRTPSVSECFYPIEPEGLEGVPASKLWGWDNE